MATSTAATQYPLFEARGAPRELGRQHGEQAAAQIRGFLEFLATGLKLPLSELRNRAARFQPLMERACPHLLEEVAGLVEGAGVHPLDALACQFRGELAFAGSASLGPAEGGCTTFVISRRGTANGELLIGQNSDNPVELMDFAYGLRLVPERGPRILMWTFGGMLGYHGLNEHGVAHFANSLGGGPGWKFALSHYPIKRMILECRALDEVRRLLKAEPVCSNGNYVLCDGQGNIADVELTSDGPVEMPRTEDGFLVHANHYLCGAYSCETNFSQSLPDSFLRQKRMDELVRGRFGALTVGDLKSFLSDHAGHPTGLCRHSHEGTDYAVLPASGRTVASLIAEPDRGLLHVSRGNPCENAYATWSVE